MRGLLCVVLLGVQLLTACGSDGVDVGAGVAYPLPRGFEVALRARYTRYFSAFHPVPGDASVAGGALDEYITFGGGVSYAY